MLIVLATSGSDRPPRPRPANPPRTGLANRVPFDVYI